MHAGKRYRTDGESKKKIATHTGYTNMNILYEKDKWKQTRF